MVKVKQMQKNFYLSNGTNKNVKNFRKTIPLNQQFTVLEVFVHLFRIHLKGTLQHPEFKICEQKG
jgi:hypothetical protein